MLMYYAFERNNKNLIEIASTSVSLSFGVTSIYKLYQVAQNKTGLLTLTMALGPGFVSEEGRHKREIRMLEVRTGT